MNTRIFIDSNIFLRHLTNDHKTLSPSATKVFSKIAREQVLAYITPLVIHEVTYVLEHVYEVKRKVIVDNILKLLELNNLQTLGISKRGLVRALTMYAKINIDFPDTVYFVVADENDLEVVTFDKDFKKLR